MSAAAPYRLPRLISLFLSFSFGVIGFAIGLNALIKSNNDKDRLRKSVPQGATVDINDNDVYESGVVVTVMSGLIALVSFFAMPSAILSHPRLRSSTMLHAQSGFLGFFTIFLFAALIPFTTFVANRSAKVTAFLGGVKVPDAVVKGIEKQLGATSVYKDIHYLRNTAILPWFAFLFGLTSTILTFLAARR
ncbi:hypothetical protein BXZ70DRAFT_858789, partial [Cristinia sonorae]